MRLNQKGMTLIEIMMVIAIIGGLMAVLVPNILDSYTKARVKQSMIQVHNIRMALRNYVMDCGSFPSTEAGLEALIADPGNGACKSWGPAPYIDKKQFIDQFNHPFGYEYDGTKAVITFFGKDGRPGGEKWNADISEEEGEE